MTQKQNLDRFRLKWFGNGFMHDVKSVNINDDYAIVRPSYADDFTPDEEIKISEGILLQSTGLKDKNGKLIYEGDILKEKYLTLSYEWGVPNVKYATEEERFREVVAFNKADLCFNLTAFHAKYSEIIGSIYENPELLNK